MWGHDRQVSLWDAVVKVENPVTDHDHSVHFHVVEEISDNN